MYAMFPHRGAPKVITSTAMWWSTISVAIVAGAPPEVTDSQSCVWLYLIHNIKRHVGRAVPTAETRCARALRPQSWGPTCSVDIPVGTCGGSAKAMKYARPTH
jgi:hypothetical protein